jgi:hypothetical protein
MTSEVAFAFVFTDLDGTRQGINKEAWFRRRTPDGVPKAGETPSVGFMKHLFVCALSRAAQRCTSLLGVDTMFANVTLTELEENDRCSHIQDPGLHGTVKVVEKDHLSLMVQWDGDDRATFVWANKVVLIARAPKT